MADEDTPEDEGADDAALVEDVATDADPVEEAAPETYTREQLAEAFGPAWERFASHEGLDAVRQAGQSYSEAVGLIGRGAHLEPQDDDFYRNLGLEPPPAPETPEEEPQGIFGAPWETPTTWDEYVSYAQSDSPDQRRLAAYGVLHSEQADQATKQWFYNQWAAADPHGAAAYIQQSTMSATDQRLAELEARIAEQNAAVYADLENRNSMDLMETIKSQVPGFENHAKGVLDLWNENNARLEGYNSWFLKAPRAEQIKEMRRLTVIAAAEAAPVRQAAQAQAAETTDAAKARARTETSRTSGAPDTEQSAAKRKSLEDARKVGHRVF